MSRKTVSAIMLTLLLTSMLTLAVNIQTVKAEGTIYIRADGSIDPPTAPISRSGNLYVLTRDVISSSDGIIIERDSITLDGAGHSLQGTGMENFWYGILLTNRCHVMIKKLNVNGFSFGIMLMQSSFVDLDSNAIENCWDGIRSSQSSNSVIACNEVSHNVNALFLSINDTTITENCLTENNDVGISFLRSFHNIVERNTLTKNVRAFHLQGTPDSGNDFHDNVVSENGYGVYFAEFAGSKIYNNNFISNSRQVYDASWDHPEFTPSINQWDDGYPSGGNYWSDYSGVDLKSGPNQNQPGNDGIGDTPYTIDSNNIDHYPLMRTWSSSRLWIEDIQPVQTLVNCSTLIPGKPTVFNMTIVNNYAYPKSNVYMLITCGSQSWYEGPMTIPGNKKIPFLTGGRYSSNGQTFVGQYYRPSGEFDVSITIDAFGADKGTYTRHIGAQNGYHFKDIGSLKILYVPVGFWGGPTGWLFGDPQISDFDMQNEHQFSDSFIKGVFPVNPGLFSSTVAQKVELNTPSSIVPGLRQYYAWIEFLREDTELKLWEQPSMGGYYRIVSVVPHGKLPSWLGYWLGEEALGMTYFETYDSVCWAEEGYWATPAHELWHSYTHISDSIPPNPWHCPNQGTGYWDQQHASLIYSGTPPTKPCVMQGGDLYHQTLPGNNREMDLYEWICQDCYAHLTDLNNFRICSDPEVLFVSGLVFDNDSVSLQPFYRLSDGYPNLAPGSVGNYSIRFLDTNQQVIGDYGFNMTFDLHFNVTGFGFAVPYAISASQIQLLHGDTVIASREISTNPPSVNMTFPESGETLTSGQNVTIQWQASDPDNETLSYTVLYTPDNSSSWIPIQTGVADTSFNWTVPNDNPADQCRVKVVATDGVNTGEAISSGTFTILRHGVSTDDIQMPKSVVGNGFNMPINIAVSNSGNYTETPKIDIYANATFINSQNVTLSNGSSRTIILAWNTTGFALGNYVISAYAEPVTGETDTTNNNFTGGWVVVAGQGDLTGGTPNALDFVPDGKVDIVDVAVVAKFFIHNVPPAPANCDVSGPTIGVPDGKIDISDVALVAKHYGEHYSYP